MSTKTVEALPLRVQLFGRYRDISASKEVTLQLPAGATVADVVFQLHQRFPGQLPDSPAVAVNRRHAPMDQVLEASDELALIPPVAGG
jgi:molybdopterin converting factor small subunit